MSTVGRIWLDFLSSRELRHYKRGHATHVGGTVEWRSHIMHILSWQCSKKNSFWEVIWSFINSIFALCIPKSFSVIFERFQEWFQSNSNRGKKNIERHIHYDFKNKSLRTNGENGKLSPLQNTCLFWMFTWVYIDVMYCWANICNVWQLLLFSLLLCFFFLFL